MPMTWRAPDVKDGVEIRDLAANAHWRQAALEILDRENLRGEDPNKCDSGSDVVWADGVSVVKLSLPRWKEQILWEIQILNHVHGALNVETPKVKAFGELDGWPYLVMEYVQGEPIGLVWQRSNHSQRLHLARELGQVTRSLHDVGINDALVKAQPKWSDFWTTCRAEASKHYATHPLEDLASEVAPFLASVGELPQSQTCLLHTELLDFHALVSTSDDVSKITSLIDFADARVGAPEYDIAAPVEFLFKGEAGMLRAFFDGYGWEERNGAIPSPTQCLAWGLQHQFGSLRRGIAAVGSPPPQSLCELASRLYS